MQFLSWCYSHIIRATGASILGLIQADKIGDGIENKSREEIHAEKRLYVGVVKRLFDLTLTHVQDKIAILEKAGKSNHIAKELREIEKDCIEIINKLKSIDD